MQGEGGARREVSMHSTRDVCQCHGPRMGTGQGAGHQPRLFSWSPISSLEQSSQGSGFYSPGHSLLQPLLVLPRSTVFLPHLPPCCGTPYQLLLFLLLLLPLVSFLFFALPRLFALADLSPLCGSLSSLSCSCHSLSLSLSLCMHLYLSLPPLPPSPNRSPFVQKLCRCLARNLPPPHPQTR